MRVPFVEIPEEGVRYEMADLSWFPDHAVSRTGSVFASVFLSRKDETVLLEGEIKLTFSLECDRCLAHFEIPRKLDFQLDIEFDDSGAVPREKEHACSSNEMDVMYVEEPIVDLHNILRQQVLLALPQKNICSTDCQGLCSSCGANLNKGPCDCQQDERSSPFSLLGKLKQD